MDELLDRMEKIIERPLTSVTWRATTILDLVRNHETRLELVKECPAYYCRNWTDCSVIPTRECQTCHGTGEIIRPMTVAEVLELAEDLFSYEGQFVASLKGRVRVRKTS